jgi:predicted membrane protein
MASSFSNHTKSPQSIFTSTSIMTGLVEDHQEHSKIIFIVIATVAASVLHYVVTRALYRKAAPMKDLRSYLHLFLISFQSSVAFRGSISGALLSSSHQDRSVPAHAKESSM